MKCHVRVLLPLLKWRCRIPIGFPNTEAEEVSFGPQKEYHPNTVKTSGGTPLKTNMSPENQGLEDVFPTEIVPF